MVTLMKRFVLSGPAFDRHIFVFFSKALIFCFDVMRMISKQMCWQDDCFGFHLRECMVIASPPVCLFLNLKCHLDKNLLYIFLFYH